VKLPADLGLSLNVDLETYFMNRTVSIPVYENCCWFRLLCGFRLCVFSRPCFSNGRAYGIVVVVCLFVVCNGYTLANR